jgi:hypothetical protein
MGVLEMGESVGYLQRLQQPFVNLMLADPEPNNIIAI